MSHEYSTEYVLPNGDMTFSLSEYVQANVNAERERIIKLLDEFIENSDLPEVVDRLEWFKDSIKGETNE